MDRVLAVPSHILDGKKIDPKPATPKSKSKSSKTKKTHAIKNQAVLNCFEASDERLTQFLQQFCEKLAVEYMLDYYLRSTYELQKDIEHLKES